MLKLPESFSWQLGDPCLLQSAPEAVSDPLHCRIPQHGQAHQERVEISWECLQVWSRLFSSMKTGSELLELKKPCNVSHFTHQKECDENMVED